MKECVRKAKEGQELLNELNQNLKPAEPEVAEPVPNPDPLPAIQPQAMHNSQYVITGGTAIGDLPKSSGRKRSQGQRGADAKKRCSRSCARCKAFGGGHSNECNGRFRERDRCEYFDADGKRRCGRCMKFGRGGFGRPYDCAATRGEKNDCEYFDENGNRTD